MFSKRSCLCLGVSLLIATGLLAGRSGPSPDPEGTGIVYVYFPSLCAAPGDPRDCKEIPQPARPAFDSMTACTAFADTALRRVNDPKVMASCMKVREG